MVLVVIYLLTYISVMNRVNKRKPSYLKYGIVSILLVSTLLFSSNIARGMHHAEKNVFSRTIFNIGVDGNKGKEMDRHAAFEQIFRSQLMDSVEKDHIFRKEDK